MINPNAEKNLKRYFHNVKEFVLPQFNTCSEWLLNVYNSIDALWLVIMFTTPTGNETEQECEQQMLEWIQHETDKIINFDEERKHEK